MSNESCRPMPFADTLPYSEAILINCSDMDVFKVAFCFFLVLRGSSYLLTSLCRIAIRSISKSKDVIQKQVKNTKRIKLLRVPYWFKFHVRRFFKIIFTSLTILLIVSTFYCLYDDAKASILAFLAAASTKFTIKYFYNLFTDVDLLTLNIVEIFSIVLTFSGLAFLVQEIWKIASYLTFFGVTIKKIVKDLKEEMLASNSYIHMNEDMSPIKTDIKLILGSDTLQQDFVVYPAENTHRSLTCDGRIHPRKVKGHSRQQSNPESNENKVPVKARGNPSNYLEHQSTSNDRDNRNPNSKSNEKLEMNFISNQCNNPKRKRSNPLVKECNAPPKKRFLERHSDEELVSSLKSDSIALNCWREPLPVKIESLVPTIPKELSDYFIKVDVTNRHLTMKYLDQDSATYRCGNVTKASAIDADKRTKSLRSESNVVNSIDLRFIYSVY